VFEMKKVMTRDGSETFVNDELGQSYHSFTGAVEEALKKYSEPLDVAGLAKKQDTIKILDVAYGMGYNSAMAIAIALEANPSVSVEIVGLENDPAILDQIGTLNPAIVGYDKFHKMDSKNLEFSYVSLGGGKISVKVLLGDAHDTIKELESSFFDLCFFDMFSPSVVPESWSVGLFESVFKVLKKGGKMSTYSCARLARDNMKKAGFLYDDGPKVGRRGPGTVAWKE